jgi:hypothetical protein
MTTGFVFSQSASIVNDTLAKRITLSNAKLQMALDYQSGLCFSSLLVNGQQVISGTQGVYGSLSLKGRQLSTLHLLAKPKITLEKDRLVIHNIRYGDQELSVNETWILSLHDASIQWDLERTFNKPARLEEQAVPVFHFSNMDTWDGAYQGYGGLAWFYLFNTKLCTYGVHTQSSSFWNARTGNGLMVSVGAPGKKVAMRYSRTNENTLEYAVTVSDREMQPRYDSGTYRRRFIRTGTDVWGSFAVQAGTTRHRVTLAYFDVQQRYGRGTFKGLDGEKVSAVLNTIARIGVIDSLHYGGNSWHTPYGPICLHEQYIAQMGLGIDDPDYLKGYQSCLDFYRDHAIKADGRVFPRWAYTDEDMMAGQGNKDGFYEAQWGILMDANPDLVTNVAELYDQTGDKKWVATHQRSCEKALDWILHRDFDGNGLVEMMNDSHTQQLSSDWIDIIWASYENAFVNAKLYHALVKWAAVERQLNNPAKAAFYENSAARLKSSFNKSTREGGFWDEQNGCYVHWLDKDKSVHGNNMVTPVNFMAIAYGICDDGAHQKRILDTIEAGMQREHLFFWPLTMTSYAPGEGKDWQFPFPNYENGDIFLSWGSIAVKAYGAYNPAIALKYVKKVLDQYSRDGLAFQRYGRAKQDGMGDDILSGNALAIVGLYQSIYGINPLYNRLYLDPHITPELSGTELIYRFRGQVLKVGLEPGKYSISNGKFKITAGTDFGYQATPGHLYYFNKSSGDTSLVISGCPTLAVEVLQWEPDKRSWRLEAPKGSVQPISYSVHQLAPRAAYRFSVDGKTVKTIWTDAQGKALIIPGAGVFSGEISLERLHGSH